VHIWYIRPITSRSKRDSTKIGRDTVYGNYRVEYPLIPSSLKRVKRIIQEQGAKSVSGFMLDANPLNRSHERMIRTILDESEILVTIS